MTYAEAVARVLALRGGEHAGMRPGLARIETLLAALGNPERRYTLVQVAGTNGKGSVSAMLAATLKAAGHRVGLYTSPHLVSFRERIRVNGAAIPEDGVADGVDAIGTLVARLDATMFEATTALALDHFAHERVDIAVLEVGLGGRLDATSVGDPAVSVITRIDIDHVAYLGSTLPEIAAEKAAIIRHGVAISARQEEPAGAVVRARSAERGVPLLIEGRDLHVTVQSRDLAVQRISCAGPGWRFDDLALGLLGVFQPQNALLAVAAAVELGVQEAAIRQGLRSVRWPGRFQLLGGEPMLVLDGAHNVAGARALADSLQTYFAGRRPTLVFGVSVDKDARAMLAALAPVCGRLIVTAASNTRAVPPAILLEKVPPSIVEVEAAPDVGAALARARATGTAVVCVAGSLFLVGDTLRQLWGDKPCPVENAAASMDCFLERELPSP